MDACVFCKIVAKKLPASVVRETPDWISFNDTNPQAPVHVVLIPKKHAASLSELNDADDGLLAELVREAARIALDKGLASGYRVVLNSGDDGGQTVPHLHFHVLGGRRMKWPPG